MAIFASNIHGALRLVPVLWLLFCLMGMGAFPGVPKSAAATERPPVPEQLGGIRFDQMGEHALADYLRARKLGARVEELPGKTLFFVYWFPPGVEGKPEKRVIVLLHGHKGNPFRQILWMHRAAVEYGFGLVALPWEWISGDKGEFRQLRPETLYAAVTRALAQVSAQHQVNTRLSAWLGFSKAAQMCARFAFLDKGAKNSFFQIFIAVSGNIPRRASFTEKLLSGAYGPEPLAGKRFYLWCGESDRRILCPRVEQSGSLLERAGAKVLQLRKGSEGHAGFYTNPEYMREVVKYWGIPKP